MKVFLSMTSLYLRSFYNLPDLRRNAGRDGVGDGGSRITGRAMLKLVGIVVLGIIVIFNFGFMFVSMNLIQYDALAPLGLQQFLLLNAVITASLLTLIIGFLTALSSYFMNDNELQFLAMPISPRSFLAAKFCAVYVSEAVFSLFVIGSALVIFGIREQPHFLFYVWGVLAALLVPLPVLSLSYLVQIPLMSFVRFLKNKRTILIIGGVAGLAMAIGFNVYYQRLMGNINNPAWVAAANGPDSVLARIGQLYPPALFSWRALSSPATLRALLNVGFLTVFCIGLPLILFMLLGKSYVASLPGFNEMHIKKMTSSAAHGFLSGKLRRGRVFFSLVRREFVQMNREPVYFLNGPFIIILMPLLLAVMLFSQKDTLMDPELLAILQNSLQGGAGAVLVALAGGFLGSATSISYTAVSRDAKLLPYLKSLPIRADHYFLAKLMHAMIFAIAGVLISVLLFGLVFRLSAFNLLAGALVGLVLSALVNTLGLLLDMVNPRLNWDNPIAALKQNPNSIIMVLGSMLVMGGTGFVVFQFGLSLPQFLLFFGLLPLVLLVLILSRFRSFAFRRLEALE